MNLAPGWLGPNEKTRELYRELVNESVRKEVPCLNRQKEFIDYPEESPPTAQEAEALCLGCPLRKLCGEYAEKAGVSWGVWNGKVYGSDDT